MLYAEPTTFLSHRRVHFLSCRPPENFLGPGQQARDIAHAELRGRLRFECCLYPAVGLVPFLNSFPRIEASPPLPLLSPVRSFQAVPIDPPYKPCPWDLW